MSSRPDQPESQNLPSGGRLPAAEAMEVAGEVARLAEGGLPLASGLRALAEEWRGTRSGRAVAELARRIEAGATLEEALAGSPSRFPPAIADLFRAGSQSGKLGLVLGELVELEEERADHHRRVGQVFAYPLFLLAAWLGLLAFLLLAIVPPFEKIFLDFETNLPIATEALLWMSHTGIWYVLGGVAAVVLGGVLFWTLPAAAAVERLRYLVPLAGPMRRWGRLGRFARLLALLVEQGVPLDEALRLVAASDPALGAACRGAAEQVAAGRTLAQGLAAQGEFPTGMIPMVDWGQRHGTLGEVLHTVGEMFQGRARVQSGFLEVLILPITLLFFLVTIPPVVMALFMPMISLITKLTG